MKKAIYISGFLAVITLLTGCVCLTENCLVAIIDFPQDQYPIEIVASNFGDYEGECVITDQHEIKQIVDMLKKRQYHYYFTFLPEPPGSTSTIIEFRYESVESVSFSLENIVVNGFISYELNEKDSVEAMIIDYGLSTKQLTSR